MDKCVIYVVDINTQSATKVIVKVATLSPINGATFSFHGTAIKEAVERRIIRGGKKSKYKADKEGK